MTDDEYAPYAPPDLEARMDAEDDLRIRMFALDMAVTALPNLVTMADSPDTKFRVISHASAEFEKILRGDQSG